MFLLLLRPVTAACYCFSHSSSHPPILVLSYTLLNPFILFYFSLFLFIIALLLRLVVWHQGWSEKRKGYLLILDISPHTLSQPWKTARERKKHRDKERKKPQKNHTNSKIQREENKRGKRKSLKPYISSFFGFFAAAGGMVVVFLWFTSTIRHPLYSSTLPSLSGPRCSFSCFWSCLFLLSIPSPLLPPPHSYILRRLPFLFV